VTALSSHICPVGLAALPLAVALAAPALAESRYAYEEVALEVTVRETDNGARAVVRYLPEVMTGGQEEIINDDGTVDILMWDGWKQVFEVEMLDPRPAMSPVEIEKFLRDAVAAVCPSVDTEALSAALVDIAHDGRFAWVDIGCPAVDEGRRQ